MTLCECVMTTIHSKLSLRLCPLPHERRAVFTRLQQEGLADALFYDTEPTLLNWLVLTGPQKAWFGLAYVDKNPAGVWLFHSFAGTSAFVHFAIFRGYEAQAVQLCRHVARWVLESGKLTSILGLTPAVYRHALAVVNATGFVEQCRVPDACHLRRFDRYVPGVVNMLTLQNLNEVELC